MGIEMLLNATGELFDLFRNEKHIGTLKGSLNKKTRTIIFRPNENICKEDKLVRKELEEEFIVLDLDIKIVDGQRFWKKISYSKENFEQINNELNPQIDAVPYNNSVTNNFYGDIHNNQLQQNTSNSTQIQTNLENLNQDQIKELDNLLKIIKDNIKNINELSSEHRAIINEKVENIEQCKKSNRLVKKGLKESLGTIRNVLEGVTGSIIASGIIYKLGLFVSNL